MDVTVRSFQRAALKAPCTGCEGALLLNLLLQGMRLRIHMHNVPFTLWS